MKAKETFILIQPQLKEGKYYFKAERENTGQKFISNQFEIKHSEVWKSYE